MCAMHSCLFSVELFIGSSTNPVQNFKTLRQPLLGEKFVVVVGGGGCWCKPILNINHDKVVILLHNAKSID